jgi:Acetyltransferases
MNKIEITQATMSNLDELMAWRMEVLHEVFDIPYNTDVSELRNANLEYYHRALPIGSHIACFALYGGKKVGCGGICLQEEMPSPDNPSGKCAYLMNIYVRPPFRLLHIGTAIVEWLIKDVRRKGADKIYLETSEAGRGMYRHLNFQDMKDLMILK